MKVIVDTNVAVVANQRDTTAALLCVATCARRLQVITREHILVLDQGWHILNEYKQNLRPEGQPGVGDAFFKWVLTNWANPAHCERVHITLNPEREDDADFVEFPDDPRLAGFDRSDRKFVAVARSHAEHPPILNAVDTDWRDYFDVLAEHQVTIEFLCPEEM
ncbi:MAG: hypothetical protein Fur0021_06610 [Candidatus Promineifilaceae bacterium]